MISNPVKLTQIDAEDIDSVYFYMRSSISTKVCRYANSNLNPFNRRWDCNRRIQRGDKCRQHSSDEKQCRQWIASNLNISHKEAESILEQMEKRGLLTIYQCSAVFFDVTT